MRRLSRRINCYRHHVPLALIAAVGLVVSVLLFAMVTSLEESRREAEFHVVADQRIGALQREIERDLGAIESVVAMYLSSDEVRDEEFQVFAESLLSRHRSLRALEWRPRAKDSNGAAFERQVPAGGHARSEITEIWSDGSVVRAVQRPEYFPVQLLATHDRDEEAYGLDVASEDKRREMLRLALDSLSMSVSAPISLVQGDSASYGFLAAAPVHYGHTPMETEEQCREALAGFVLGVFDIDVLVGNAMNVVDPMLAGEAHGREFDVRIYAYSGDGAFVGEEAIFARRFPGGMPIVDRSSPDVHHVEHTVHVRDRQWLVSASPVVAQTGSGSLGLPWSVMASGMALTFAAAFAFESRRRGMERLELLAAAVDEKNVVLERLSSQLSHYVSDELLVALNSGEQDESIGTRWKILTIFYSDIQDFSRLSARLPPETLNTMLNDYFSEISAVATRHGATIDKFVGDALLMYFGDPESKGEAADALACVRMAIEMRERMVEVSQSWHERGLASEVSVRIGINTGYCSVGNFGGGELLDYTAIGDEVNVAVRLHSVAKANGIVITQSTYDLVSEQIEASEMVPRQLKGIERVVVPYEVIGLKEPEQP